jgi:hypothetical protein
MRRDQKCFRETEFAEFLSEGPNISGRKSFNLSQTQHEEAANVEITNVPDLSENVDRQRAQVLYPVNQPRIHMRHVLLAVGLILTILKLLGYDFSVEISFGLSTGGSE